LSFMGIAERARRLRVPGPRSVGRRTPSGALVLGAIVATLAIPVAASGGTLATVNAARAVAAVPASTSTSSNWAGYAVTSTGTTYTSATATWVEPTVTCTGSDLGSSSSFWVGLGGYNVGSKSLEQVGTDADCSDLGTPTYYAWYELVPSSSVDLSIKVEPGNTITVSVNALDNGTVMELQLINRSRGVRVTKKIPFATPDLSSAEWIAEAPSMCNGADCRAQPLADFSSVTFTNIAAIGNAVGGTISYPAWTAQPIQLVPGQGFRGFDGQGRYGGSSDSSAGANPGSLLSATGNSFQVGWVANAAGSE
jgi:hypothetical protein